MLARIKIPTVKYFNAYKSNMTGNFENKKENRIGGKEPMNPEDIGQDAIDRGQDKGIAEGGRTGTNSSEAQEKYRKKGMTEV
jgi:hypothetical protein